MRDIVQTSFQSQRLIGTVHWPQGGPRKGGSAVVFYNSGFLPRSPVGDLTTHLGDTFSELGLPVFRFDLPGLGDSEGDLPGDVETFFGNVLNGSQGEAAASVSKFLIQEFKLEHLLIGGICGGAVSAIYAAASGQAGEISGLILMDPRFKKLETGKPAPKNGQAGPPPKPTARQRYKELRVKVLQTRAGENARKLYRVVKPLVTTSRRMILKFRGEPLPAEANVKLITAIKSVVRKHTPILLMMAGSEEEVTEQFDYIKHINTPASRNFACVYMPKVSHSFTEADGETLVARELRQWLANRNLLDEKIPSRRAEKLEPALS